MRRELSLALAASLCGCLDWASVTRIPDAPADASLDVTSDVAIDAPRDVAVDVALDTTRDAAVDAALDAAADAPRDVAADVSLDAVTDAARDVTVDVASDATTDVASDVRADVADVTDASDADTCAWPRTRCGSQCLDLNADRRNCGACGRDCGALAHVNASWVACSAGRCVLTGACASGFGDCDRNPDTGCESQLTSDVHCGTCGGACGPTLHCLSTGGPHACACVAGEYLCNGVCMSLEADVNNCGACGNRCATMSNAVTNCLSSRCSTVCYPGFRQLNDARCVDFGGATVAPDLTSAAGRCVPNPLTGACACPSGFTPQTVPLIGYTSFSSVAMRQALTICNDDVASAVGDWGGMMMYTTGGACVVGNPLGWTPGDCLCPAGTWDRQVFSVTIDMAGTTGVINTCTRRALSGTVARSFLGAYQEYVDGWHSPSGATATCIVANPRATGCSCPAGASSVAVRMMVAGMSPTGVSDPLSHAQLVFCMQ